MVVSVDFFYLGISTAKIQINYDLPTKKISEILHKIQTKTRFPKQPQAVPKNRLTDSFLK